MKGEGQNKFRLHFAFARHIWEDVVKMGFWSDGVRWAVFSINACVGERMRNSRKHLDL